jgi:hypothetical protein
MRVGDEAMANLRLRLQQSACPAGKPQDRDFPVFSRWDLKPTRHRCRGCVLMIAARQSGPPAARARAFFIAAVRL